MPSLNRCTTTGEDFSSAWNQYSNAYYFNGIFDDLKVMLGTSQPGELPLMREVSAVKRARSLKDPSTVKSSSYENATAPSNFNRKIPSKGRVSRNSEAAKGGSGRGGHYHVVGRNSNNSLARRLGRRSISCASKVSSSQRQDDDRHVGWDLGVRDGALGSETRQQQNILSEADRKTTPNSGEDFSRNVIKDCKVDSRLLQNWATNLKAEEEAFHMHDKDEIQNDDGRGRPEVSQGIRGVPSCEMDQSFEFRNQIASKRSPSTNRRPSALRRETNAKQNPQILSPLTLNSHDDSFYSGCQQLSFFSLEGPSHDEQEKWKQEVKVHPSTSRSASPFGREQTSQAGLTNRLEKSKWAVPQDLISSSSHTSQRTLSQVSIPGAWDASLDDELDVSELPQHGYVVPCNLLKGKSRCECAELSMEPSMKKAEEKHTYTFTGGEDRGIDQVSTDLSKPMHGGELTTALVQEVAAMTGNGKETSPSDGLRGRNDGVASRELTSDNHAAEDVLRKSMRSSLTGNIEDDSNPNGRELAVFVERPRSLCQKYRPKTFEELVGQGLVTHALANAIARGKVAPVYLFQGSRGTGKTSAARIFAAALNCISSEDMKPCNLCRECISITSGKSQAVQEVDATSHIGIEHVKTLIERSFTLATTSQYKVSIIDECHLLTSEAWASLLKLLDEPPRNVVVILSTADSGKLPRSAVSRCQKFMFSKIKHADIVNRLQKIAILEKMDVEPGALDLIASKSEGSLRDAETMLDQLSLLGQRITLGTIHELVGSVSDDKLLSLLDLALSANTVSTVRRARELIESGIDPLDLMSQLATLITDILAGSYEIMTREQDKCFFSRHALSEAEMERLRTALKILSESEKQLREASKDRTTWLTAALLRFGPEQPRSMLVPSTSSSDAPSPISRSSRATRKVNEFRSAPRTLKREVRRKTVQKRMSSSFENKIHGSTTRGASRCSKPGYDTRVHPTDLSSRDASRELSSEYSLGQTTVSNDRDKLHARLRSPGNLRSIWLKVLETSGSLSLRQLLQYHGRLLAMSLSAVDAVVHLEFSKPVYKYRAERYRKSITNIFKKVLGLSVKINITLASFPHSTGSNRPRMWVPDLSNQHHVQAISQQFNHYIRSESDDATSDGSNLEVGSLRHWKSQGGGSLNSKFNQSTLPYSFPEIPMVSIKPPVASRRQHRMSSSSQSKFGKEMFMQEAQRLETAWIEEERMPSSFQFYQNPSPQKLRISQDSRGHSLHPSQSVTNHFRSGLNMTTEGLHAQKYVHGFKDAATSESSSIEQENLRMESKMRYGGLLCWKAPKETQEKAIRQRRRRKQHGILIRLVPCAKSGR
ncbi:hypothetical protein KP509_15G070000 [Ceratopteris richardii]|uniref:Uncharacterized protein n=2 Tax=Ceratopteris richardii TaxID=49495 RepID=A0A8T2T4K4_CERRI|nr:hypothetical protein KP509_15G070000 [Ceratopteris richardii]